MKCSFMYMVVQSFLNSNAKRIVDKIPPRQHVKIYCLFLIHVFEIMASGKAIHQLALILFPM